jgi:hypothetical protein
MVCVLVRHSAMLLPSPLRIRRELELGRVVVRKLARHRHVKHAGRPVMQSNAPASSVGACSASRRGSPVV